MAPQLSPNAIEGFKIKCKYRSCAEVMSYTTLLSQQTTRSVDPVANIVPSKNHNRRADAVLSGSIAAEAKRSATRETRVAAAIVPDHDCLLEVPPGEVGASGRSAGPDVVPWSSSASVTAVPVAAAASTAAAIAGAAVSAAAAAAAAVAAAATVSACDPLVGVVLVGRSVRKLFGDNGMFEGKVTSWDEFRELVHVDYEDGDEEELELYEVWDILLPRAGGKGKGPEKVGEEGYAVQKEGMLHVTMKAETKRTATREECILCYADFSIGCERHIFWPCQHARACGECALKVWKEAAFKRRCPECRARLEVKPKPFKPFL